MKTEQEVIDRINQIKKAINELELLKIEYKENAIFYPKYAFRVTDEKVDQLNDKLIELNWILE